MNCRKLQHHLEAYVDGQGTAGERRAVELHVGQCAACARELQLSRRLAQTLAGMPARPVSEAFEQNLRAALDARRPAPSPTAWWERLRLRCEWRLRSPAMVTAGSLAMACVAVLVSLRAPVDPGLAPPAMAVEQRRGDYVSTAVERYRQLEAADRDTNWEALDASIQLSTGSVITE